MIRTLLLALAIGAGWSAYDEAPAPVAPKPIDYRTSGVGRFVEDLPLKDLSGKTVQLSTVAGAKGTVIALTGIDCPLCKKYGPSLAKLESDFRSQGFAFVYVNPEGTATPKALKAEAKRLGLSGVYVDDRSKRTVSALGATSTTELFVLDSARTLVYRGALDDQYGLGYSLNEPRETYVRNVLAALAEGKAPALAATTAPGCVVSTNPTAAPATVDYYRTVSRIVESRCVDCHREGGSAPFSLQTLQDVKAHASTIKNAVETKRMPPWFAKTAPGASEFKNDRSLTADEIKNLTDWCDHGTPAGDPKNAPKPKVFTSDWKIGKPDAIYQLSTPINVKATGVMEYQNVVVDTDQSQDRWVQRLEIRPTAGQVVHHVLVWVMPGKDAVLDKRTAGQRQLEELTGFFAAYVPGNNALIYPDGFGKLLPKGARLRFQIHYTPNGTATQDQCRIGMVFASKPIEHEVRTHGLFNFFLNIPPGESNYSNSSSVVLPFNAKLMSFMPHMHVRGKAARYEIEENGKTTTLLDIPRYDFNWQLAYDYREPRDIAKGSKLTYTAWYDNSDKNPANPDPTKRVHWGDQTFDEMLLGYVEYYIPGAKPGEPPPMMGRRGGN